MFRKRPARVTAVVALLLATAAGCGDAGGLRAAGSTETAVSPARLWPSLRPAASPAWPYDEVQIETVKGITAPGDDIREVDPVAVVRAEIAAHPSDYQGAKAPYRDTGARLAGCGAGPGHGDCPVLRPYYRDLTGDGRDDLTLGFRLYPTNQTAVRVYTFEGHRLVQVFANDDAVIGVELAGRAVIIRSPAGIAGYEYRTSWSWDADQRAMVFTRDEFLRTGPHKPTRARTPAPTVPPSPVPRPAPSETPAPAPGLTPSALPSESGR
ncbi:MULTISPECIES: hypothetical protein [unclassified Streptomyces]|uniref:hypothetical protein n=1 Tax=unclassified Streptomyces TaxID=2593676 RepID=UPI0003696C15|nr:MULTISPECIES: hypothetical protein [unclassified Streptomyces]EYT83932.1 lipoprotein [Streptomyces sp. Tu 6176]